MFRPTLLSALALGACATGPIFGLPPEEVDYGALRFSEIARHREAFAEFVSSADRVDADTAASLNSGLPVEQLPDRCDPVLISRSRVVPWVRLAEAAPDYESWRRDRAEVRERVVRVERVADSYAAGNAPANGLATPSLDHMRDAMNATDDASVRELLRRALRDQTFRIATYGDPAAAYTEGLTERARRLWPRLVTARLAEIDCANTAWLRIQVAEHGWFDIQRFGQEADEAAWLIVQHADRTPGFQADMLRLLESLPEGATNPRRLAYLWDRVAVKEGRPQRYGTQMHCVDGEARAIGGVEEGADERRAALGMPTFASYQAAMRQLAECAD